MEKRKLLVILLTGICALTASAQQLPYQNPNMTASAQQLPYQNPNLTASQRADDLLSRLTLEEKVSLMMDTSPAIERLGIPQFQWWNEALHGIGRNGYATVFPITMAMAASWDDALLHKVFTAVSDEARVKARQAKQSGNIKRYQSLSFWTPNINIFRDPRWGRGQETYGEDPYLTSKMGLAVVRGLQGMTYEGEWLAGPTGNPRNAYGSPRTAYKKLLACAKHYAVHRTVLRHRLRRCSPVPTWSAARNTGICRRPCAAATSRRPTSTRACADCSSPASNWATSTLTR